MAHSVRPTDSWLQQPSCPTVLWTHLEGRPLHYLFFLLLSIWWLVFHPDDLLQFTGQQTSSQCHFTRLQFHHQLASHDPHARFIDTGSYKWPATYPNKQKHVTFQLVSTMDKTSTVSELRLDSWATVKEFALSWQNFWHTAVIKNW